MEEEKKRILVVDDDPVTLKVVRAMLEKGGYAVETALSGKEALDKVKQKRPDLAILDIVMPEMDGVEVLNRIKEIDENIAAVMLTAHGTVKSAVEAFKFGAYDYIDKPVSAEALLEKVGKALSART